MELQSQCLCFYIEEFRGCMTASAAGKNCISRCSGILGHGWGQGGTRAFEAARAACEDQAQSSESAHYVQGTTRALDCVVSLTEAEDGTRKKSRDTVRERKLGFVCRQLGAVPEPK